MAYPKSAAPKSDLSFSLEPGPRNAMQADRSLLQPYASRRRASSGSLKRGAGPSVLCGRVPNSFASQRYTQTYTSGSAVSNAAQVTLEKKFNLPVHHKASRARCPCSRTKGNPRVARANRRASCSTKAEERFGRALRHIGGRVAGSAARPCLLTSYCGASSSSWNGFSSSSW